MTIQVHQQTDLERFKPTSWDDVTGNKTLKDYFSDMIYCIRMRGHRSGFNLLATGPSRDGKTATITFGIKCLLCCNLDIATMNPCNSCENCTSKYYRYGNDGWNNSVDLADPASNPMPVRFHYIPIDCTHLTETALDEHLMRLRVDDGELKIVYLDEVHRLVRRGMDEKLLKPSETCDAIWIASSAVVEKEHSDDKNKLEKMFQNRFTFRLKTERPTVKEMLSWLVDRCKQFEIEVENPRSTLNRLIERSGRSPGMSLQVLNKAHKKRRPLLTMELVEEHVFDFDD